MRAHAHRRALGGGRAHPGLRQRGLPGRPALVRYAKRLADRLHAPWTALHIETARNQRLTEAERDRIADTLRLAERLGRARRSPCPGDRVADDVLAYASANNITQIVIGKSHALALVRAAARLGGRTSSCARRDGISVHVIAGDERDDASANAPTGRPARAALDPLALRRGRRCWSALALGVGCCIDRSIDLAEHLAGLPRAGAGRAPLRVRPRPVAARRRAQRRSPTTSSSCRRSTPSPSPTPRTSSPVLFFLVVAVVDQQPRRAAARTQMVAAGSQARTTAELYAFSRKLAGIADLDDLLWAAVHQIAAMLKVEVVILLPDDGRAGIAVQAAWPPEDQLDEADLAAARWAWEHNQPAGRGADTLPGAKRLFLPHAHRPRRRSACSASHRDEPRAAAHAGRAPPARRACSTRPRSRSSASQLAARRRRGRLLRRDRAAALGAAGLGLARSADAARLDPRHASARCAATATLYDDATREEMLAHRRRRRPSGSTASSTTCST